MIYLIASAVIALAVIGLRIALRDNTSDRALGYSPGSYERRTLEGLNP